MWASLLCGELAEFIIPLVRKPYKGRKDKKTEAKNQPCAWGATKGSPEKKNPSRLSILPGVEGWGQSKRLRKVTKPQINDRELRNTRN